LKSPAATTASRDGSTYFFTAALTSAGVSEASFVSKAESQAKVRPTKEYSAIRAASVRSWARASRRCSA
jgi:hypothetical protein